MAGKKQRRAMTALTVRSEMLAYHVTRIAEAILEGDGEAAAAEYQKLLNESRANQEHHTERARAEERERVLKEVQAELERRRDNAAGKAMTAHEHEDYEEEASSYNRADAFDVAACVARAMRTTQGTDTEEGDPEATPGGREG